ncbi:beta-lactamase family protein [Rhizobium sp. AQ_MP]|uniref:serine hydrolase domain-containing protein n=1 Tax=Rhizobium sp. AQ_MP TaxID=2761536 RepID=UPI0016398B8A|nr:serine hydrolase domain-containing protein [Rhizobium sp. AQ_MP]MBC2775551.1 beta-lactamase family protein [Rhizobium sp. AQ_MP]
MSLTDFSHGPLLETLAATYAKLPGQWPLTGGIVGVVTADGMAAHLPFGRDFDGREITARTPFLIGSISKFFTGLMLSALMEEGRLTPDDRASSILPWLAIGSDHGEPTLRHLLHHTAGLVKGADDPPDELAQVFSLRDSLTASPPGSFFHYSNLGYNILGLIITALASRHATDHAAATLLAPLGMVDGSARLDTAIRTRVATGSQPARDDIPWRPGLTLAAAPWVEAEGGDGSIAASSRDMTRLMTALLNDGRIDGVEAIAPAVLERATTDLAHAGEGGVEDFGGLPVGESRYGYGINVETTGGNQCLSHGGGMIGHSSFMLIDRTAGLGIIVLTNANGCYAAGETLARHVHAALLHGQPLAGRLDLVFGTDCATYNEAMVGRFVSAAGPDDGPQSIDIAVAEGRLMLTADGASGAVYRGWGSRLTTDHPAMERFHLSFDRLSRTWSFGGRLYRPVGAAHALPATTPHPQHAALVGRYRSYSPWCPTFRIVLREGRPFLISPGGVEGPDPDMELVPIGENLFRIGADPRLPERLRIAATCDGRPVTVYRDSCRYSRMSLG